MYYDTKLHLYHSITREIAQRLTKKFQFRIALVSGILLLRTSYKHITSLTSQNPRKEKQNRVVIFFDRSRVNEDSHKIVLPCNPTVSFL